MPNNLSTQCLLQLLFHHDFLDKVAGKTKIRRQNDRAQLKAHAIVAEVYLATVELRVTMKC